MGRKSIDLAGKKMGRWTVIRRSTDVPSGSGKHARWECRCECGAERTVNSAMLLKGRSASCGCLQAEKVTERNIRHGMYGTRVYEVWNGMLDRCNNKNHKHYASYGGRGIKVCDRWQTFDNFMADMGEPPADLTIDRWPNNDGNYDPGNCRWATNEMQQNNKRNNRFVEIGGARQTIAQWARQTGLPPDKIGRRLDRGWSPERAISP